MLPIVTYPDPRLKRISEPVGGVRANIRALVNDMLETMYAAPGVGLSAPQVGKLLRVIVIDVSSHEEGCERVALIDPQIVSAEGEICWEEGCLSVPDMQVETFRHETVRVKGLDLSGKMIEMEADGLLAIALQHELDHLNGRLIIDRVSPLKRELYRKKRLKAAAQNGV